jgi:NADPH:quinone reductase-like Zn-dependent oxidoreductase
MYAIRLRLRGGPEALVYEEVPLPRLGDRGLLVRVLAAAVTPTELQWSPTGTTRTGGPRPFPIILGHEFSGEVQVVGPGVTDLVEGAAIFRMNDWFRDGAQAEYCVARRGRRRQAARTRSCRRGRHAHLSAHRLAGFRARDSRPESAS